MGLHAYETAVGLRGVRYEEYSITVHQYACRVKTCIMDSERLRGQDTAQNQLVNEKLLPYPATGIPMYNLYDVAHPPPPPYIFAQDKVTKVLRRHSTPAPRTKYSRAAAKPTPPSSQPAIDVMIDNHEFEQQLIRRTATPQKSAPRSKNRKLRG